MKKVMKRALAFLLAVAVTVSAVSVKTVETEAAATTNYTIKVNLGTNCTTIYNKKGKAIKSMICSPSSETPTGTFYVPAKYRWHEMIGNCYAQYCTRITTGILFHSVWYYTEGDKSSMSVSAYNVMGQKASHGCVRLLCKDAKWIYDHCAVGTKIVIFWGTSDDDPLGRPSFTKLTTNSRTSWDPTDPDKNNPYRNRKPTVTAKSTTIEYGTKVKAADLVTIKDSQGNTISKSEAKIKVSGKINTKKLGKYKIKYTVTDSVGKKTTKAITFKVVDTQKPIIKGAKSKKNVAMGSNANVLDNVTAKAVSGKNLTSRIKVTVKHKKKKVKVSKKGSVIFSSKGKYKITYKVKGTNKKVRKKTVTYKVTDQRVKLTMTAKKVTIKQGSTFNPYSYVSSVTTYKGKKMKIKSNVTYSGTVDTSMPGTYTVTYTAMHKNKSYTKRTATLKVTVEAEETTAAQTETTTTENEITEVETETTATQTEETIAVSGEETAGASESEAGMTGETESAQKINC